MRISPLGDRVVVTLLPPEKASSTIELVNVDDGGMCWAVVDQVGPEAFILKPGDTTLVRVAAGVELGDGRLIIPEPFARYAMKVTT